MYEFKYYLPVTGDYTDRTEEIRTMLERHGVCLLGAGTYVVSGIDMPAHTTLMGMGGATTLLLREDVEESYAVRIGSFCTIKDLELAGSAQMEEKRPTAMGKRHGITFLGNATTKDSKNQNRNSMISGCFIRNFSGGGITCTDTGYSTISSLIVSNCHILYCGAGINISHFSEYHKFDSILSEKCYYGLVNNGGNNMFVNCGFNCNATGILMDNSSGLCNNNSHGSMVGCTINHTNNNEGIGLHAIGMAHGYMFSGCQMFFSKIDLTDCKGFVFDTMNYGRKVDITVRGGGLTMFTNSAFNDTGADTIRIIDNDHVKFVNCYTRGGEAVGV